MSNRPQFKEELPIKIVSHKTNNDYKTEILRALLNFREELKQNGKCIWNRQNDLS